jgi:ADP-ribose pyrophosphatase
MKFTEKQLTTKTVYEGRIVSVRTDTAELVNGSVVYREVVEHPGGVAIVPVNERGEVYMVRQYRYPVSEELLEIPAGKLEPGEDPYECAVRELCEETGCMAGSVVPLGPFYPSPGFSKEVLHIYLATQLVPGEMKLDEDELLDVETVPLDVLTERILSGEIKDAKTIIGILKAKNCLEH